MPRQKIPIRLTDCTIVISVHRNPLAAMNAIGLELAHDPGGKFPEYDFTWLDHDRAGDPRTLLKPNRRPRDKKRYQMIIPPAHLHPLTMLPQLIDDLLPALLGKAPRLAANKTKVAGAIIPTNSSVILAVVMAINYAKKALARTKAIKIKNKRLSAATQRKHIINGLARVLATFDVALLRGLDVDDVDKHCRDVDTFCKIAMTKKFKVLWVGEDDRVVDISGLDCESSDQNEASWGHLFTLQERIGTYVRDLVNEHNLA